MAKKLIDGKKLRAQLLGLRVLGQSLSVLPLAPTYHRIRVMMSAARARSLPIYHFTSSS